MNDASQKKRWPMLINGELTHGEGGQWLASIDPATEETLGYVPSATAADVNNAVSAAERAQPAWAALSPRDRGNLIRKVADRMRERADEILRVEVEDTGNTITKMARDVGDAAGVMDMFAGLGTEIKGETIPASANNLHFTLREPYGVVARIVPFNHPIKFASHALSAPLMAGNAVVIKPPEQSPLSASILGEICRDILPAGVVNIVTGNGMPTGDALVRHPVVKRIAFTGSVPTGMAIQRAASEVGVKAITLELGGKNPLIAFPDMDPAKIAEVAVAGMNFSWQGQSCGSTSRLLLHEDLYAPVIKLLQERVEALRVGMPLDPKSEMGPINSERQYRRVLSMIESAHKDGATLLAGGKRPEGAEFSRGYWVRPTVFGDVKKGMTIAQEEVFGPVLSVMKWKTEDEAIDIANSTEYGLTASIWTNDLKTALRTVRRVRSGYIWVNGTSGHHYGTPFGGMKNSGLGREECLDELLAYTENKTVHVVM